LHRVLAPSNAIYIKSIHVSGGASPEGPFDSNRKLSARRASAIHALIPKRAPELAHIYTVEERIGIRWKELRQLVETDLSTPRRVEILNIIDNVEEANFAKNISRRKSLMDLGVPTWKYLLKYHFPELRSSAAVFIYLMPDTPQKRIDHINAIIRGETTDIDPPVEISPTVPDTLVVAPKPDTIFIDNIIHLHDTVVIEASQDCYRIVRPLAFKTNLLFDLASLLNVEVEVPLSQRWSVAGEWMFPWWLWEEKQHALELLQGSLEARYWLTNNYSRQDIRLGTHNPLTGWFVGLYGGGGYYDLEWNKKGYQGEFFIATGLSAGYLKPIGRNLSMEFSLGVGYLKTDYRHYQAKQDLNNDWQLVRQNRGSYTWIGPTKAKISLVWYPHFKAIKKGVSKP
ncbi:MAG: DUF3575 domain-containing protein, partial [Mucinivorans sp.]